MNKEWFDLFHQTFSAFQLLLLTPHHWLLHIHTQIMSGLNSTCGFYHWFQQVHYFLLILHLPIALRGIICTVPRTQQMLNRGRGLTGCIKWTHRSRMSTKMWAGNPSSLLEQMWTRGASMENSVRCLQKLRTELPDDPAIPLFGHIQTRV